MKVVNLFNIKAISGKKEREDRARLEKAPETAPNKPSQVVIGEKASPVIIESHGVVPSTGPVQKENRKESLIDSRRWQSAPDVHGPIRDSHKLRAARRVKE